MTAPLARRKSRIVKNRSSTVPMSSVRSAAPSVIGGSFGCRADCARPRPRCHEPRAALSLRRLARDDIGSGEIAFCRGDAMRRVLPAVLSLCLVAGCAGGGPLPPGPIDTTEGLRASFPKGGLADTIAIDA